MSNTGDSVIVCGPHGEALSPLYINRRGHLACSEHALFVIKSGYHLIFAHHHREDFNIRVYVVKGIGMENRTAPARGRGDHTIELSSMMATIERQYQFDQGQWDKEVPTWLEPAIDAACSKATHYHCREPHYIHVEEESA